MPKEKKSRLHQPGDHVVLDEGVMERKRYTIAQRISYVNYAKLRMEEDLASMSTVADECGVSPSSLSRWFNKLPIYRHIAETDQVRLSLAAGRRGQLEDIGSELLAYIDDLREKGYAVSRKMIVAQASRLFGPDSAFSLKSFATRGQSVSRWMAKVGLTTRTGTHQAQALPQTVLSTALDFILNIARPAVSQEYRHPDFIMNMDETPVYFSMHPTKSVEKIGTKTVNIRIAKNAGQRATVAVGITASGIQLKSLIIFKGKPISVSYYFNIVYLILCCISIRRRFHNRQREQQRWHDHPSRGCVVPRRCILRHAGEGMDERELDAHEDRAVSRSARRASTGRNRPSSIPQQLQRTLDGLRQPCHQRPRR